MYGRRHRARRSTDASNNDNIKIDTRRDLTTSEVVNPDLACKRRRQGIKASYAFEFKWGWTNNALVLTIVGLLRLDDGNDDSLNALHFH